MKITNEDRVMQMAEERNGIVTTREIEEIGISSKTITRLVRKGMLKKATKGMYVVTDFKDRYFLSYVRCKQGIFSHETSLELHGLIDEIKDIHITIPSHYNTRILKNDGILFYYLTKNIYEIGKKHVVTEYGNTVYTYDIERTICDIFIERKREDKKIDPEYANKLLGICLSYKELDKMKVREYAEKLGVLEEILNIL